MKTIYLLRHAKSSWDDPDLSDFERPLNKRGEKSAPAVGKEMKRRGVNPAIVVCSPAKRTKQTARLALKEAKLDTDVFYSQQVYLASHSELLSLLRGLDDGARSVLLIGHNPGLEDLLHALTGEFKPMVTAALACVTADVKSWKDLSRAKGRLSWLVTAKELLSG